MTAQLGPASGWLRRPTGADSDDVTAIERAATEPAAFAVLYYRYAAEIQRYATRRLGVDAAEDVTSETFLVAFRQRRRYDRSRASALPWLYGIATNLIGRHRRTELAHLRVLARTGVDPVLEAFTDRSDARVSADAVSRRLAEALAQLPAGHRSALLLVVWADLTYEEAAHALGVPIGTVRSRISRARDQVRRALGGVDPTNPVGGINHG